MEKREILEIILAIVCMTFGQSVDKVKGKGRKPELSLCRQHYCKFCADIESIYKDGDKWHVKFINYKTYEKIGEPPKRHFTLGSIGRLLQMKHDSVLYSMNTINDIIETGGVDAADHAELRGFIVKTIRAALTHKNDRIYGYMDEKKLKSYLYGRFTHDEVINIIKEIKLKP